MHVAHVPEPSDFLVTAEDVLVRVRPMEPSDRAYVASSWATSYEDRARVPKRVFRAEHRRVIDHCLDSAITMVVCSPQERTALAGFVCGTIGVLHYVYLAHALRGFGVARRLVDAVVGTTRKRAFCTHRFEPRAGKPSRFQFNPYLAHHHA